MRRDHGRMMALVARTTAGDLLLAEDALQQASLAALQQWPHQGLPDQSTGWLVRCARNKAIDQIRRNGTRARAATVLAAEEAQVAPEDAEVHGLMALMLLQDARRDSRVDGAGRPVLLADQDRSRWDRRKIALGMAALGASLRRGAPGPTTLQAAIASVHMRAARAEDTDWTEIVALYDLLLLAAPSPVVQLNRAVAVAEAQGPEAGLALLEALTEDPHLARGHLLPSARAALLSRQGRRAEAAAAYAKALERVGNEPERAFLQDRLRALGQ